MKSRFTKQPKRNHNESGQMIVLGSFFLIILLVVGGLAVDAANLFLKKSQLQRSLDASVMAGINRYGNGVTDAPTIENGVVQIATYNLRQMGLSDSEITNVSAVLSVDNNQVATLNTTSTIMVSTFFMRLIPAAHLETVALTGAASARRVPAVISLVLDTSGSMRSEGKLQALKGAANSFVDSFQDNLDRMALIRFAYRAEVLQPMALIDKAFLHNQINSLSARGPTNISDAVATARQEIEQVNNPDAVRAILIFTDGAPNTVKPYFTDGRPPAVPNFPSANPQYSNYIVEGLSRRVREPELLTRICRYVRNCFNSFAYLDSRFVFRPGSDTVNLNSNSQILIESYDLAIIEADYGKADGTTVYAIGLGTQAPEGNDPYQDEFDWSLIKSILLRRLANDPASAADPVFPGLPNDPSYPAGIYLQTPNPADLSSLFDTIARRLKLRLIA